MSEPAASAQAPTKALIVGSSPTLVWGLTGEERLRRTFATKGIPSTQDDGGPIAEGTASVIGIRGDLVIEATLVVNLMATEGMVLCLPDGRPVAFHVSGALANEAVAALRSESMTPALTAAVKVVHPKDLAYNRQLRKRATPYVLPISEADRPAIEKQVFAGSYKGVTDIATKYFFPWPVRQLTHVANALRLRPNHVTFVSFLLAVWTVWLWCHSQFVHGVVAAWGMCLLDSVDGKLARVTLTSSKLGDTFDHGIDLIHPPFWYWGWMVGLGAAFSERPDADLVFWVIMVTYVLQRLLEGLFISAFKVEMHIWRRFDSMFRLVTARRNPNLILLTVAAVIGRPLEGILVVAAWMAISLVVHVVQVLQAALVKAKGQPIDSWLTQEAATD